MVANAEKLAALQEKIRRYDLIVNRELQSQRGGLIHFVRYFWDVLEPNTPLVDGWPLEAICDHLEATAFGECTRLLIVVPPGFCKSLLTDVFFPAWMWSAMGRASSRFVAFSYAAALTERDNGRFRDLMLSTKFQEMWGQQLKLRKVGETKVSNSNTGWKLASSVGGVGTGERADWVLLDDPHSIKQIESEVVRTETVRWFREAMSNRLNDMETGVIIIIMQRSHDLDVAGVVLRENMGYCTLLIDMEYDTRRQTAGEPNAIGWVDPREEEGELAWPERFSASVCVDIRNTIGPYAWAAQYQQMPVPRGGGIIKRDWWQLWDGEVAKGYGLEWNIQKGARKEFPEMELVCASLDTSFGEKQENDLNAMTVWGVWLDRAKNRRAMLMYAWAKRLPLHGTNVEAFPNEAKVNYEERKRAASGLVELVADTCKRYRVKRLLIENKTRGHDVANELVRLYAKENFGVEMVDPVKDKVSRTHAIVPLFTDGAVWAPNTPWADAVLDECEGFPKYAHDDLHDTVTQFLLWARHNGLLIRGDEASYADNQGAVYHHHTRSVAEQYGV